MSSIALPRLASAFVEPILDSVRGKDPSDLADRDFLHHEQAIFPSASGERISDEGLAEIRGRILGVARQYGFPDPLGRRTAHFDRDCAVAIHDAVPITPHEAASQEMWVFVTCVLLVDVAVWRFPGLTRERFHGSLERNVFRRLWMRVEVLGPPRGDDDPLWSQEDALVQIMERTAIAENRGLARAIADVFRKNWGKHPGGERAALIRDFLRRVVRRQALARLECLCDEKRLEYLEEIAGETTEALVGSGLPSSPEETRSPVSVEEQGLDSPDRTSEVIWPGAPGAPSETHHRDVGVVPAGGERIKPEELEDIPLNDLMGRVLQAMDGLPVHYAPRQLDLRLLQQGVRVKKNHKKTVEQMMKQLRNDGRVVESEDENGEAIWTVVSSVIGENDTSLSRSIEELTWLAARLGLTNKEDRAVLVQKLGLEEPLPKYLRRVINVAISSASRTTHSSSSAGGQ